MKQDGQDRRLHPRWVVGGRLGARIGRIHDASLIDISAGGALIEHLHLVRPGSFSLLSLILNHAEVGVQCRVVRSAAHRCEVEPTGERTLIYRTGLEFLGHLGRIRAMSR
jgi:hypothetical protein